MPAKTEAQRKLMAIALSIKRGETPASYSKQAAKMASQMSEKQLKEYAHKKKKKLKVLKKRTKK